MQDYQDWEKLISSCDTLDGLTSQEKESGKGCIPISKSELGDKFLTEASKERHPSFGIPRGIVILFSGAKYSYIGSIMNVTPWTRKWITWLADALKKIKSQNNYLSLLNRIKNKSQYIEALSVLDIAYKLTSIGSRLV